MLNTTITLNQQETQELIAIGATGVTLLTPDTKALLDKLLGTIVSQCQEEIMRSGENFKIAIQVSQITELQTLDELRKDAPFLFIKM